MGIEKGGVEIKSGLEKEGSEEEEEEEEVGKRGEEKRSEEEENTWIYLRTRL